jgi:nucleotide-binding universal stress UspA family protein
MYRTLLVPLDGSPFAEHALPLAVSLARRAGAALRLVTVSTPLAEAYTEGLYFSTLELQNEIVARQQTYLDEMVRRLAPTGLTVQAQVLQGDVAETLWHHAGNVSADLVVMATHGRGPLGRFWLGSVADELIRHLHRPVLLVRPEETAVELTREALPSRVLLPLDGTDLAEQVLEPAVALAALLPAAEVTLLRVIKPVVPVHYLPEGGDADKEARHLLQHVQTVQGELHRAAEAYLGGIAARLRDRGLRVHTRIAVDDHPATAILREAQETQAGLIALETHGRRGLSRLIVGSVADKVVRGAHVPILVHRPAQS